MNNPKRPVSHVLATKSSKFLEGHIPNDWHYNVPNNDYGIDYQVEISLNEQVTGLNFSIQLKSTENTEVGNFAKVALKRTTLNYYRVRLEPVMLIIYDADANEAYWSWINDHDIDYAKNNKTFQFSISKTNKLSEINWAEVTGHVQRIFNAKSFISDFDILKIEDNIELAAWKTYYEGDYEQAIYLFRRLISSGNTEYNLYQALAWSLYQTYQYNEALNTINLLLDFRETDNGLKTKACILAEAGFRENDKGKIIQARNLFKRFSTGGDSALMLFNYGNTLNALGNFNEAIEQYKFSLAKEPNHAQCWKNLGTTYCNLGQHDQEICCYDKALEIDPDLPQALFSKGITLAQHYKKYQESLALFHHVLDVDNSLFAEYVNGLFWVAYCYEQIGDLTKALFWVDRGLNHEGSNPYFLNFKSNLLGKNWRLNPELKEKAIEFFEYRIELQNDFRSLYHLIIIQEHDLAAALNLVKDKSNLYKGLVYEELQIIGITLDDLLVMLLQLDYYMDFRVKYPTTRYLDHIISQHFSIGSSFFNLLDLIFGIAFNRAIVAYGKTNEDLAVPKTILEVMLAHMPKLVHFLIPEDEYSDIAIAETMLKAFQGYIDLTFREIGAQSGHITVNLELRNIDPSEYITDEYNDELGERIYNSFVDRLTGGIVE